MSDWWQKRLGGGQPAQPRGAPVPQAVPPEQRPMQQVPQQYAPPGQVQQQPGQYYDDDGAPLPDGATAQELVAHNQQRLATKEYREVPREAKAVRQHGKAGACPDCGSGNFFSSGNPGREHQHCYDCGYPIVQAGSGSGTLGGAGMIAKGGTHAARSPVYVDPNTLG